MSLTLTKLSESEKKIVKDMSEISEFIFSTTEQVYFVLKSCVASYFLISIINFWNLSLMYNVLNISTIPAFSKKFLEKLTFLFFNLNSLTEWAQSNIPSLKGFLSIDQTIGREFMEETKNHFAWFGSFGVSSNFVKNNLETLFLIFLMALKIFLILIVRKIPLFKKLLP